MDLDFITLDVFTSTPYEGNPLAVVKVPAHLKDQLSQKQKQLIAREFNLSETVYIHENLKGHDEWVVDIFTTDQELPFAGHPTIGSAFYLLNLGPKALDSGNLLLKAGKIDIRRTSNGGVAASISHNVRIHQRSIGDLNNLDIALSSKHHIAEAERQAPLVSIVKGMTFMLVKLPSLEVLAEVQLTGSHSNFHEAMDEGWAQGLCAKYYYVMEEEDASSPLRIRTRMLMGALEDPATGSAACALSSYLALNGMGNKNSDGIGAYEITQGVEMSQKSVIEVKVETTADRKAIKSVVLSGYAVQVMEGKLRV